MFADPVFLLIASCYLIPALLIAIPLHELGHAVAARLVGQSSAGWMIRQSFAHPKNFFNVYGVVAVLLANVGWGNPLPIDESRLGSWGKRVIWALGGPVANLLTALLLGVLLRSLLLFGAMPDYYNLVIPPLNYLVNLVYALYFLNLSIFAFQLLPIPGLDGWRILEAAFGSYNQRFFYQAESNAQTIWVVCILLVLAGSWFGLDLLGTAVGIFFHPASTLIVGQCSGYVALHPCLTRGAI